MDNRMTMLKIENVSKTYRLGEIGGTTLIEEFQRIKARIFRKEDPTKKIGSKSYNKGETFDALKEISIEIKKGERIGIIGHNGAGKSTLLKLISRVTGPTSGNIYLNGRVASMLEVGTGFHPELTGRENIYMNGAILGMTKKEIDAKMDDIIEFSEVRRFIDTPVKRYSSGMYVKLAFSVAAHLDSEIIIMDEVLAVGDVAFQDKCLNKMKSVSEQENRTILYVSHNMETIKRLCNRVIVLNQGRIIFDGDVDKGIATYVGSKSSLLYYQYSSKDHYKMKNESVTILSCKILKKNVPVYEVGEQIEASITINSSIMINNTKFRFEIYNSTHQIVGTCISNDFKLKQGINEYIFLLDTNFFVPEEYLCDFVLYEYSHHGHQNPLDGVYPGMIITIQENNPERGDLKWMPQFWGYIHLPDIHIKQ